MRLLIVTQYFWPENFRINDVVEQLVERGHDVTVLTGFPNYPSGRFAKGYGWRGPYAETVYGAKVVRAPLLRRGKGGRARLVMNYVSFALASTVLGALRCREAYDAIFVFEPSPITIGVPARIISWLRGAPVLMWVQDLWPETLSATGVIRSPLVLRTTEKLVRWVYRGCERVLVQSEAFVDHIAKQGVPREKILYLPNSAEPFFRPIPKAQTWNGPPLPKGFRVMFAGNIGAAQSFETILSAAAALKPHTDIHWLVVGEGRQLDWVRDEVRRLDLGGQVHFYGHHPVETMPDWFAQSDVMLVTLRDDPIFAMTIPSKIQSYMACGKPIVAALNGEGARVIRISGAGIAVPARDAGALAEAVLSLYRMSDLERAALGENGLRYFASQFSREAQLNRLEGWFRDVARGADA